MSRSLPEIELTAEQADEAERILDILMAAARVEGRYIARLLASKSNRELFGETEFQVRDAVHRLGARGLDAALRSATKGVPRDESRLPGVRRRRQVRPLSGLPCDDRFGHSGLRAGVLSLLALSHGGVSDGLRFRRRRHARRNP